MAERAITPKMLLVMVFFFSDFHNLFMRRCKQQYPRVRMKI